MFIKWNQNISKENKVIIAKLGKTHGVKGEISVNCFLEKCEDFNKYKCIFVDHQKIKIQTRISSKKIICSLEGISDLDKARKFSGKLIAVDRNLLPNIEGNQFYFYDLVNLNVFINNREIGKVNDVKNHGAGDYLEIVHINNELLVPMIEDHILDINLKTKKIQLNPKYYEF